MKLETRNAIGAYLLFCLCRQRHLSAGSHHAHHPRHRHRRRLALQGSRRRRRLLRHPHLTVDHVASDDGGRRVCGMSGRLPGRRHIVARVRVHVRRGPRKGERPYTCGDHTLIDKIHSLRPYSR